MEMDEMELDRYITGLLDSEHRNLKKNLSADKPKKKRVDKSDENNQRVVETNR